MKKLVMMILIGVAGFMALVPSFGYCDQYRRGPHRAEYVVVRDDGPRYHQPVPVHYHQKNDYYAERRDEDRSAQMAVAVLGGVVVGTLLGTAIAQGR